MKVANPLVGDLIGHEPLLIAEVAQAHDGSLGTAHAYIDAVKQAGARAVKFQTHIAAAESSPDEPWRVRFSPQDETRYEYWRRMEFTADQWDGLYRHATEAGLLFLSSAFSPQAVDLLERIGMQAWKVGSGEVTNLPLLERMARTGKPILLSSGMSTWQELDAAVAAVRRHGAPMVVLQCTSMYPCPPEKLGLNVMSEIRDRYGCPVGLSDHSGTIFGGLAAVALGASVVELHVTFSRQCFGPDVPASITIEELKELARGMSFIHRASSSAVEKEAASDELAEMKRIFGKSVVAARDLAEGSLLTEEDLAFRKPGTGIPVSRYQEVVHRRLRRAVAMNQVLKEEDLEPAQ